jgi:hypothetical protein
VTNTRRLAVPLQPLLIASALLVIPAHVQAAIQSAGLPPLRREYPLNCRGGEQLVFDTISPPSDTGTALRLSLTFAASQAAAGPEGQGLQPSTCAWVDRPVNDEEPRQIRMTIHMSDSTPRATVRDTGMYWGFLAHNSDSGYITAVGYRHWHASSPPLGLTRPASSPAPTPSKGAWLPFNPRHLHWYVMGWVVIAWVPMLVLTGLWSGWRRLARLYPHRSTGRGDSFRAGPLLMGLTNYRGGARLTADDSHLHFSMGAFLRPGHPPFSVPWSDVSASHDTWPWFPLKGHPVIRLTLARHRGLRILLPVKDSERIVAASGGRLLLTGPSLAPPWPANASRPRAAETPTSSRR